MLARILYALVFAAGVPALLAFWAIRLEPKADALPHVTSPVAGLVVAFGGGALMLRAMWDLLRTGRGLPMNVFPPPRFVVSGAYRLFRHPIYVGFGAMVAGVAIATGSAAGLWIVTPVVWLAMTALVVGYERIDLQRRFGSRSGGEPWWSYPHAGNDRPTWSERFAAVVVAFGPWLLGYEACVLLTPGHNRVDTTLAFERHWPVVEWTAVFYLGAYAWTALAPFAARERNELRLFVRTAWCGTALIVWCFLVFPFFAPPRPLGSDSAMARILEWDRSLDSPGCALPSFHVFWAFAAAQLWARRIVIAGATVIAILIAVSCVAIGVHTIADVVTGWLAYVAARHCDSIWNWLRDTTERLANSWRDWRVGRVRIINHGGYVAAAAALGVWLIGLLLGPIDAPAIITVALCSVAGAGVWGQWLEASSQLSRPFGYFGGLFGACLGTVVAQLVWGSGWRLLGAYAVAAPLIQAVGRMRCLVQGCCHGRLVAHEWLGIRYTQPLSRVCKIANLGGQPVHPTPLYSILGNVVIIGLLARLWHEGADLAFIAGTYFILGTCARFMEEGYRGEPQTVRLGGLPIYQWLAIGCLLVGILLTTLPAPAPPAWNAFSLAPLLYALPIGLLVWFAMGVDFPESSRRMSRLA